MRERGRKTEKTEKTGTGTGTERGEGEGEQRERERARGWFHPVPPFTGERVNLRDAYADSRFDTSPDTLSGRRTKARARRLATLQPYTIQAAALCDLVCSPTPWQAAILRGPACNPTRLHLQPKRPSLQPSVLRRRCSACPSMTP